MAKILKDVNETIGLNETVSGALTQFVAKTASANSHYVRISSIAMIAACTMWASGVYTAVALNPHLIFCHFSYLIIKTVSLIAVAIYPSKMSHLLQQGNELVM